MDHQVMKMRQDLARSGYATSTQLGYRRTAEALQERFGLPIDDISRDQVRTFVDELSARGRSASWLKVQFAGLRFLYGKTLGRAEYVSFLSWPKQRSVLPTVLSQDEVARLLQHLRKPTHQALAMVMYSTGLRIGEVLALETRDIDGARGVIRVRNGKGNKAREVNMTSALYAWLRAYWGDARPAAPYLFASRTGRPPMKSSVRAALAEAAGQAGIEKKVTPHVLRHCFATHMLEAGTDVRVVQVLMGHSSILTTAGYTRVTRKLVQELPSPIDLLPTKRQT